MLSSVVEEKPVASTWLDRLRLSKGLSTTEDDDDSGKPLSLDDFLRRNHQTEITGDPATSSASDSPHYTAIQSDPEQAESPLDPGPGEWYGVVSDVLSELFNFGDSSRSSGKKLARKQSNPKHCSIKPPVDVSLLNQKRVRELASSYSKKPETEMREKRRSVAEFEAEAESLDEEEKVEKDLIGFSRSEVTVIDTSFNVWKSEKLVFRRRNLWKVRDKKGKSRLLSSKKKTLKKKKKKKRKRSVHDCEIPKKSKKMKIPENTEDVHNDPESSNANRILLSRLPSKPKENGSFRLHTSKKKSFVAIGPCPD